MSMIIIYFIVSELIICNYCTINMCCGVFFDYDKFLLLSTINILISSITYVIIYEYRRSKNE